MSDSSRQSEPEPDHPPDPNPRPDHDEHTDANVRHDEGQDTANLIHQMLGASLVLTLIGLAVADVLPEYVASRQLSAILAVTALVLLGFGSVVAKLLERR